MMLGFFVVAFNLMFENQNQIWIWKFKNEIEIETIKEKEKKKTTVGPKLIMRPTSPVVPSHCPIAKRSGARASLLGGTHV